MYAQVTNLTLPANTIEELRGLITNNYFKSLREREGFIEARMLEAVDDDRSVKIVTYWESQKMIESARKTGSLQETIQMLSAHIPGIRIVRQAYVVTVHVD